MQHLTPAIPESLMERMNRHRHRLLWCYSTQCYIVINANTYGYVAVESNHISGIEEWMVEQEQMEAMDE